MPTRSARFDAFYAALADEGLSQALAVLNRNVPHRYTAVYRLEDAMLHNHSLFDKLGAVLTDDLASVPLGISFCQFVLRDGVFSTSDSGSDGRLAGHPYQGVVVAYTGVPITEQFGAGEVIGTLCHFDSCSQRLEAAEFELLQQAAKLIRPAMIRG